TNTLNDYVSFVYYAEVDTPWGQAGSTPSGSTETGGTDGADGVNLETKNVYLDVKIPDTMFKVRAGIQGLGNKNYTIIGDDIPALRVDAKVSDQLSIVALYSKFFEDQKTQWDDEDFYFLLAKFKPTDASKLNVGLIWYDSNGLNDRGAAAMTGLMTSPVLLNLTPGKQGPVTVASALGYDDADLYILHADGSFDLGMVKVEAQAAYQFGSAQGAGMSDIDFGGYMASAKASANVGAADVGLRLTYYSSDDNANDNDWEGFVGDVTGAAYEFPGENLHIFFADKYYNNTAGGRLAMTEAAYTGAGLFAINGTANVKLGGGYDLKAGAGYFMALEDTFSGTKVFKDTDMGFEVGVDFGRKLAEKVDVRLIGSYAVLGDFFAYDGSIDPNFDNNNDPDDIYLTKAVINVSF
ncbi:MAG: hypothetical protein D6800_10260, partial [Candidatus Zixiibacteriota bacterium]